MSKKLLFGAVILAILASGAFAVDLLASVTNGKISDNSPGVKVLSLLAEFKQNSKINTFDFYASAFYYADA